MMLLGRLSVQAEMMMMMMNLGVQEPMLYRLLQTFTPHLHISQWINQSKSIKHVPNVGCNDKKTAWTKILRAKKLELDFAISVRDFTTTPPSWWIAEKKLTLVVKYY